MECRRRGIPRAHVPTHFCNTAGPSQHLDSAIAAAELLSNCPAAAGVLLRCARHQILAEAAVADLVAAATAVGADAQGGTPSPDLDEGTHCVLNIPSIVCLIP